MSCLVIAEKPSVAQSIARVLEASDKKPGYMEGSGFIISWCIGHLVVLETPEAYDPKLAKWNRDDLPILPAPFKFAVSERTKAQFDILANLMNRADVETVVCATDAGREGELIFRLVYEQAGCKKPVKRLWISSMEDSAIREGFRNLKDGSEYDALYRAALCRLKADWLVGINMTRLLSTMYGLPLSVGRVQSPTLSFITQREQAIREFQPEPFYTVALDAEGLRAQTERMTDADAARRIAEDCEGHTAYVVHVVRREKQDAPPKLYDLTSLQRDANRLLGITAQQTLDYAQHLYEMKLVTYPRTDSRYLTSDMAEGLPALVRRVAASLPFAQRMALPVNTKQIIDDAKVSDHHALIPTATMPGLNLDELPEGERQLLTLIAVRLLCAVGEPYRFEEIEAEIDCAGHRFTAKGKRVTDMGWRAFDSLVAKGRDGDGEKGEGKDDGDAGNAPFDLSEGQTLFPARFAVHEGKTTPPARYSEGTLLSAMEAAGSEDMPEDAERRGIGTPATRATIIEKLVKFGFVEREGGKVKQLVPTDKGKNLAAVLPKEMISAKLTAEWEQRLKEIERGNLSDADFLSGIADMVARLVKETKPVEHSETLFPSGRKAVGTCPLCGALVTEAPKGFFCENRACRFRLWKDNRFFMGKGKPLDAHTVATLLKDGQAQVTGFVSKTGKPYSATVVMEYDEESKPRFRLMFN